MTLDISATSDVLATITWGKGAGTVFGGVRLEGGVLVGAAWAVGRVARGAEARNRPARPNIPSSRDVPRPGRQPRTRNWSIDQPPICRPCLAEDPPRSRHRIP